MGPKIRLNNYNKNLSANGWTLEEQAEWYEELLEDIQRRPRWWLNRISSESLTLCRVGWHDYRNTSPPVPYKFTRKGQQQDKDL